MAEYIEFVLLDEKGVERNVMMNKDDENEVYVWKDKWRGQLMKKPYWWRIAIGDRGGGYSRISITGKHHQLHRVCYYAHNPEWDIYDFSRDNSIDHIDRDKKNNHISNLREATQSQNSENNNAKGYYYHKKEKRWVAQVTKDGKQYTKRCNTEAEAIAARAQLKAFHHTY